MVCQNMVCQDLVAPPPLPGVGDFDMFSFPFCKYVVNVLSRFRVKICDTPGFGDLDPFVSFIQ